MTQYVATNKGLERNTERRQSEIIRKKRQRARKIANAIRTSILCIFVGAITWLGLSLVQANKTNENLTKELHSVGEAYNTMNEILINRNEDVMRLNDVVADQDKQIQNLSEVNQSMVDELNKFRERSELYDKYEYAIIDEMGNRTHLTYEEIKLGEELMLEKGYDPHLMMATIMAESTGDPSKVNSSSGATGYGQFLNSTAKWVYEKLMGHTGYYPDLRKDGVCNITMMAEYYDYLYNQLGGSTFRVIKSYSGNSTDEGAAGYLRKINSHTNRVGVTIQ